MKYNISRIMRRAWWLFRQAAGKSALSFAEALHRAWLSAKAEPINAQRIEVAKDQISHMPSSVNPEKAQ